MSEYESIHPLTRREYEAEIRALEEQVERLTGRLGAVEEEIVRRHAAYQIAVDSIGEYVRALEAEKAAAEKLSHSLVNERDSARADVDRLWQEKAAAEAEVVKLAHRICGLEGEMGSMGAAVQHCDVLTAANDSLARQLMAAQTDLQRVRGALEPFARLVDELQRGQDGTHIPCSIPMRDLVAAKAALTGHAEVSNPCPACKAAGFPECHGPHLTGHATGERG